MIIGKSYLGASPIKSIYLGASKVYPKSSFLPETNLVIEYGQDHGYLIPTAPYLNKLNGHIRDLIDFNLWGFHDLDYWMVGDGDMDFKTINVINPDKYKGVINGGLVNTLQGIAGNAIDGYVDTGFNPSIGVNKYTEIDAGRYMYVYKESSVGTTARRTLDGVAGTSFRNFSTNIGNTQQRINCNANIDVAPSFSGNGYTSINRISSMNVVMYKETNEYLASVVSDGLYNANQITFAKGSAFGDNGLSCYGMGAAIVGQDAINHRLSIINNL